MGNRVPLSTNSYGGSMFIIESKPGGLWQMALAVTGINNAK